MDGSVGSMLRARGSVRSSVFVCSLFLASCTVHLGSDEASSAPGSFHREDLDAIVLTPDDAPPGTGYAAALSGFQDLDAFAKDAQERSDLIDDGFVVGHAAGVSRNAGEPRGHRERGPGGELLRHQRDDRQSRIDQREERVQAGRHRVPRRLCA